MQLQQNKLGRILCQLMNSNLCNEDLLTIWPEDSAMACGFYKEEYVKRNYTVGWDSSRNGFTQSLL